MPLSWNEIRKRATTFAKHWQDASDENSQAKPFLIDFFEVFGITDKRVATFEHAVKKFAKADTKQAQGFVDLFWPGILLVEMKSKGKNLERAYDQAIDYFSGIQERDLPRYVLVSDFQRFRLFDLSANTSIDFALKDLYQNVKSFGFIAGYQTQIIKAQDPINIKAAERMGKLHDALKDIGYEGHALELYLVRLLFCLFAEDTTIFEKRLFQDYVETKTAEDGSDLAHHINSLFYVLNTAPEKRLKNLDEHLAAFPYVNGKLFEEPLPPAQFDKKMREALLDLCALDWSRISPAIFGSLFQSIMNVNARRNLGAHYTSEENILKLIKPLFLDRLWAEFEKVKTNKKKLAEFHQKLSTLTFFDPACGCGNFLVITYRELRLLELEVLRSGSGFSKNKTGSFIDVETLIQVDVDQFYGIEIEEFPAQIAQVALWLTDHQMNMRISDEFGNYFARIPLKSTPHIVNANALQKDWAEVIAPEKCSYILGNPPFVGAKFMDDSQRTDAKMVFNKVENGGLLDFVAAWYVKAAQYVQSNKQVKCAFVSTNSITQGEQVGVLWGWMLAQGIKIHFAHRTFSWSNEARGKAAVHCVIVGFAAHDIVEKTIFEYDEIKGEPHALAAKNINPYLVDAVDVVLPNRTKPICDVSEIRIGNKPIDDGNYLFSDDEKNEFLKLEPNAEPYFKRWLGAHEFINGYHRWCLWLGDCSPKELRSMPYAMKRVQAVKDFRLSSKSAPTQKLASTPTRFHVENMPNSNYLIIPEVSSENRQYIPIGFESPDTLASNLVKVAVDVKLTHFAVLTSTMHMAWVRSVCGRLKSDFRYSGGIVYNNYPWPEPTEKQTQSIETAAQAVLNARAAHPNASLADLYDPLTMPANLLKSHQALDKVVDAAYNYKGPQTDAARVAFLFELYRKITSLLPMEKTKRSRVKVQKAS
jgi:hypothetical protein